MTTIQCRPIYFTTRQARDLHRDWCMAELEVVEMKDVKGEGVHKGMFGLAVSHNGPRSNNSYGDVSDVPE